MVGVIWLLALVPYCDLNVATEKTESVKSCLK